MVVGWRVEGGVSTQCAAPNPPRLPLVPYAAPAMRARARVLLLPVSGLLKLPCVPFGRGVARACMRRPGRRLFMRRHGAAVGIWALGIAWRW